MNSAFGPPNVSSMPNVTFAYVDLMLSVTFVYVDFVPSITFATGLNMLTLFQL